MLQGHETGHETSHETNHQTSHVTSHETSHGTGHGTGQETRTKTNAKNKQYLFKHKLQQRWPKELFEANLNVVGIKTFLCSTFETSFKTKLLSQVLLDSVLLPLLSILISLLLLQVEGELLIFVHWFSSKGQTLVGPQYSELPNGQKNLESSTTQKFTKYAGS